MSNKSQILTIALTVIAFALAFIFWLHSPTYKQEQMSQITQIQEVLIETAYYPDMAETTALKEKFGDVDENILEKISDEAD